MTSIRSRTIQVDIPPLPSLFDQVSTAIGSNRVAGTSDELDFRDNIPGSCNRIFLNRVEFYTH